MLLYKSKVCSWTFEYEKTNTKVNIYIKRKSIEAYLY